MQKAKGKGASKVLRFQYQNEGLQQNRRKRRSKPKPVKMTEDKGKNIKQ